MAADAHALALATGWLPKLREERQRAWLLLAGRQGLICDDRGACLTAPCNLELALVLALALALRLAGCLRLTVCPLPKEGFLRSLADLAVPGLQLPGGRHAGCTENGKLTELPV